jgi:uncharacterized protein (TIGR03435 family)
LEQTIVSVVRTIAVASVLLAVLPAGHGLSAQGNIEPSRLQFDLAAVKANHSDAPPTSRFPLGIGDAFTPGGIFSATNQPLVVYLRFAFKLAEIDGLPSRVNAERFDIEARAASGSSKDDMRVMMQRLLRERFGLLLHVERQATTGLGLRLSKAGARGPSLHRANPANCATGAVESQGLIVCGRIGPGVASTPGRLRISGRSIPLSRFATFITNPVTGIERPVFDQTALAGLFDLDVEWNADEGNASDLAAPSIGLTFGQALNDQLGLRLVKSKGTIEVLKFDRIERPMPD